MSTARRTGLQAIGFLAFCFVIALLPLFWRDRWERIHTVDFLQILAAGALLGMLLSSLLHWWRSTPRS